MIDADILYLKDEVHKIKLKLEKMKLIYESSEEGFQLRVARAHLVSAEALLHQACGTMA